MRVTEGILGFVLSSLCAGNDQPTKILNWFDIFEPRIRLVGARSPGPRYLPTLSILRLRMSDLTDRDFIPIDMRDRRHEHLLGLISHRRMRAFFRRYLKRSFLMIRMHRSLRNLIILRLLRSKPGQGDRVLIQRISRSIVKSLVFRILALIQGQSKPSGSLSSLPIPRVRMQDPLGVSYLLLLNIFLDFLCQRGITFSLPRRRWLPVVARLYFFIRVYLIIEYFFCLVSTELSRVCPFLIGLGIRLQVRNRSLSALRLILPRIFSLSFTLTE